MPEHGKHRHGLESFLATAPAAEDAAVSITVRADTGFVNLRGSPGNPAFPDAAAEALGQNLPLAPNRMSFGDRRIYWLGPDEWLIVTAAGDAARTALALGEACSGVHVAVNDVSGGNIALHLTGDTARDVLARGCTLDLHPDVFSVSSCAQSGLARANILLGLIEDTPTFEIVVRRSFADYLCRWLAHTAKRPGVRFSSG
jgi:sarcosine oxidase subunit gamma